MSALPTTDAYVRDVGRFVAYARVKGIRGPVGASPRLLRDFVSRYDGLVGWITDGQFGRPWEARAMQLQQGEVSEVLEIPEGFLIVRADVRERLVTVEGSLRIARMLPRFFDRSERHV